MPRKTVQKTRHSTRKSYKPTIDEQKTYENKIIESGKKKTDVKLEELRRKLEKYLAEDCEINVKQEPILPIVLPLPQVKKDCKHLSNEELNTHFENLFDDLNAIREGKVSSDRHYRFINNIHTRTLSELDLRYNASTLHFSNDQITYILKLMRTRYQNPSLNKLENFGARRIDTCNYFYEVLIPEFCAKLYYAVYGIVIDP